jgi:hypothetical protein
MVSHPATVGAGQGVAASGCEPGPADQAGLPHESHLGVDVTKRKHSGHQLVGPGCKSTEVGG